MDNLVIIEDENNIIEIHEGVAPNAGGDHDHDDRYYTETETDTLLDTKQPVGDYATTAQVDAKADNASLSTVAKTGQYADLQSKPTIPVVTGTNTGDETATTIKSKLGISTLSGVNTGDQDISGLATISSVTSGLAAKVDKVVNKQLSTEDYTTAEKNKLSGIATGAEVNVNADWNATSGDAQILNKPTIPTVNYPVTSVNAKTGAVVLNKADVGLSNVDNTSDINKPLSTAQINAIAAKYDKTGGEIDGSVTLISSNDGGEDTTDSTSRLNLQSYQRAQSPRHFGEVLRIDLMSANAKGMIAWRDAFTNPANPETKAWIGWHYAPNDLGDPVNPHDHISIETQDANGLLQTRFEVLAHKANTSEVRVVNAGFTVANQASAVTANANQPKQFLIATNTQGRGKSARWVIEGTAEAESGSNVGTNLKVSRFDNNGNFIDNVWYTKRDTGYTGIGHNPANPVAWLDVSTNNEAPGLRVVNSATSSSSQPSLYLLSGLATNRAIDMRLTTDTIGRFLMDFNGGMAWGAGSNITRDTFLNRSDYGVLSTPNKFTVGSLKVADSSTLGQVLTAIDNLGNAAWQAITKSTVGLSNVDNTSDAAKPISTATQTALNGKANTAHTHSIADLTATGTRDNTTYLRGDGTWAVPAGGGGGTVSDATTTTKGIIQLAEDLGGTASNPQVTVGRLLSYNYISNPSFESGIVNGWTTYGGGTKTHDTTTAQFGTASAKQSSATATDGGFTQTMTGLPAGTYTLSFYAKMSSNVTRSNAVVRNNGVSGDTQVFRSYPGNDGFVRYSQTFTNPTIGNVEVLLGLGYSGSSAGEVNFDGVMVQRTASLEPYFDGSSTSDAVNTYSWTGTPNASTSLKTTKVRLTNTDTLPEGSDNKYASTTNVLSAIASQTINPSTVSTSTVSTGQFITSASVREVPASITGSVTLTTNSAKNQRVTASGAAINITLPTTNVAGYLFKFKRTDATAQTVTILGTIDGVSGYVLTGQYSFVELMSTSTNNVWEIWDKN